MPPRGCCPAIRKNERERQREGRRRPMADAGHQNERGEMNRSSTSIFEGSTLYPVGRCLDDRRSSHSETGRPDRDLAPDVVRIRLDVKPDWNENPAIYFRVTMSDEATRKDRLWDATELVRARLFDELRLEELDHQPYFKFRGNSEQAELQDPAWA
jgi:hypothetical protein